MEPIVKFKIYTELPITIDMYTGMAEGLKIWRTYVKAPVPPFLI